MDAIKERLKEAFASNFAQREEVGAAVSLWHGEAEVISLEGGFVDRAKTQPWTSDSLVLIWSATKGLAASCILHSLEQNNIDLSAPVISIWPEFGRKGKEAITLSQLLSHQSGVSALDDPAVQALDHQAVVAAIEDQAPYWAPGTKHGYSPRLFGFLLDELIRRLNDGETLGQYWRRVFAEPMDLDIWIGLPESEHDRVAEIIPPRAGKRPGEEAFMAAMSDPQSLTAKAFSSPRGPGGISSMNQPLWRSGSFPSFGGIAKVRDLAKFYSMLAAGGHWNGREFVGSDFLNSAKTTQSSGLDAVLLLPTAFSAGFMKNPENSTRFGRSPHAFGHPGAGGSIAFADPDAGIGFAYAMNQMGLGVLPGTRAKVLVDALG